MACPYVGEQKSGTPDSDTIAKNPSSFYTSEDVKNCEKANTVTKWGNILGTLGDVFKAGSTIAKNSTQGNPNNQYAIQTPQNTPEKEDNTIVYIGLGIAGVLFIAAVVWIIVKNRKQ